MGLRDEIGPKELRQGQRVDGVRLHLGLADGLELSGVGERQLDAVLPEEVSEPVPAPAGFNDGTVGSRQRLKIAGGDRRGAWACASA